MLKNIVVKQKEEKEYLLSLPYLERRKLAETRKHLDSDLIKVILGPRRAGKSVFALTLLKERPFLYFNFDEEGLLTGKLDTDELMRELHFAYGNTKTILFDEIQNLLGWELFTNRLHRNGYNMILTGSNAKLLGQELATHLTGRYIPIGILPFDFQEFLRAKQYVFSEDAGAIPEKKALFMRMLERYLLSGGYPEVVLKDLDPRGYLDVLFDAVLFQDVIVRHNARYSRQIRDLGTYLMDNVATEYTFRRLTRALNFRSGVTLEKYLRYLIEAYAIFSLDRYSFKSGERIRTPKKAYVVDNGFIAAKAVQHAPDTGKLLENLVFMELVKQGKTPNLDLFSYKTRSGKEVDFILKENHRTSELIQVAFHMANPDIEKRETGALFDAARELNASVLTIITWDEKRSIKKDNHTLEVVPLAEWLMR